MHIGIDITSLIYHRGVSRYTRNLVMALLADNTQLTLYGSSLRQKVAIEKEALRLIRSYPKSKVLIESLPPSILSKLWKFGFHPVSSVLPTIDLFHSWDWLQPPDKKLPLVSTIHDLAILKFPDTAHPDILKAHQRSWKILKERNAQIIAVSQATKRDIVSFLEIPPYNIHVVPEALPIEVRSISNSISEEDELRIKQNLHITRPFILFVGSREPRKNIKNLIQAWAPLASQVDLLVAGESGWDGSESLQHVSQDHLRFLGKVSDKELSVLYAEAEMLAYPSLYEGFGLPILEAFHYGTPVVTSNVSSMIEVAGNAAELVEPTEVESIRTGIENILNEDVTAQQKRLQRMIIRQQMFDWTTVAKQTKKVYARTIELHQSI